MRFYTFLIFTFLSTLAACHEMVRLGKTGQQPPPGMCNLFMFGGISRIHFYECCNNCNEERPTCDGKTYQSASKGQYCDKCGVDNSKGNGIKLLQFACGGCKRQDQIDEICLEIVRKQHLDKPGFCWLYAFCFSAYCVHTKNENLIYSNRTIPDTCFDLQCGPGETIENCPIDCCGSVNQQCKVDIKDPNAVPPKCCMEYSCCK